MHLNRKIKVIYSSLSLDFNACGGPWIQFVLLLNGPNHSTVTLLSRLMLFQWPNSWKIYSRMILVLSPCSLMVDHYGYAGLLINDVTPHWCVFLLFSRKNLGAFSLPLFSSDLSGFRQCIMQI